MNENKGLAWPISFKKWAQTEKNSCISSLLNVTQRHVSELTGPYRYHCYLACGTLYPPLLPLDSIHRHLRDNTNKDRTIVQGLRLQSRHRLRYSSHWLQDPQCCLFIG